MVVKFNHLLPAMPELGMGLPNAYERIGFVWRFSIIASFLPSAPQGTDHRPLFPRLAPRASRHPSLHPRGPAGAGRARTLPRWLLPGTNRRIAKDSMGSDLDERPLLFQYVTGRTNPSDKSVLFPSPPPPNR